MMIKKEPITVDRIKADLQTLGLRPGMTIIVHSSMKSLGGWILGGPVAVIMALEQLLGVEGTLVMPTHTGELSDPSTWVNPPVDPKWWDVIRNAMPGYDPDLSPTYYMGAISECFRKQKGTLRSSHPQVSFAARGRLAERICGEHSLENCLGEASPLAKIYEAGGYVLLLGVGYSVNTSLHLAEYRANYPGKKQIVHRAPIMRGQTSEWVEFADIEFDEGDFADIGQQFERDCPHIVRRGNIVEAPSVLVPQKDLVDFATVWMERNRNQSTK